MNNWKKNFLLLFYLIAGILVGALIADVCKDLEFLSWLSYYLSVGFNPANPLVLDLSVFTLTFGFSFGIYIAQIFTIGLAIFAYNKTYIK